jgi:hypothetical protein
VGREETFPASAPLSAETSSSLDLAWLFVELANPHFFLDSAPLNQFPETADGLLGRLLITQRQLYHTHS